MDLASGDLGPMFKLDFWNPNLKNTRPCDSRTPHKIRVIVVMDQGYVHMLAEAG